MYKLSTSLKVGALMVASLLLFAGPGTIFAVEGTCSWHSGVNCSAGSDWDGSPICNDGWRDSSESYWSTQECLVNRHFCSQEDLGQLDLKYGVTAKGQIAQNIGSQLDPYIQRTLSGADQNDSMQKKLNDLLEIQRITAQQAAATSDYKSALNQYYNECYALGDVEFFKNQQDFLKTLEETSQQSQINNSDSLAGYNCPIPNMHPISTTQCACDSGFSFVGGECVTAISYCQKVLGPFSYVEGNNCACLPGYTNFNNYCRPESERVPATTVKSSSAAIKKIQTQTPTSATISTEALHEATTTASITPQATTTPNETSLSQKLHAFFSTLASPFKYFWKIIFK